MESYDLVVVGSGFAGTFFLKRYLENQPNARVLVLERGAPETHSWKIKNRELMDASGVVCGLDFASTYNNLTPEKPWIYTPSLGGSSNCWWGCTPRFMPNDFKLKEKYGVGRDWPIEYGELEPYYCQAERIIGIAGPEKTPFPKSEPYPLPAHHMNDVDRVMLSAYPELYFGMPTARPSQAIGKRSMCCASSVCNLCPVDAKFTILNSMAELFEHTAVTLRTNATALAVEIQAGQATGVIFSDSFGEHKVKADLVALGANAIFNVDLLHRSGVQNPALGRGLSEQIGLSCSVFLKGLQSYNGSSALTAHGYMLYDGEHRRERAACLVESHNIPRLRTDVGAEGSPERFRERADFKFVFEDLPEERNQVRFSPTSPKPEIEFNGHSEYAQRSIDYVRSNVEKLFACLPVEHIEFAPQLQKSEGHILCTAPMGEDPQDSVVDRSQRLHDVRNVLSLGGSSFATVSPANPTLTIAALSLYSADQLTGSVQ